MNENIKRFLLYLHKEDHKKIKIVSAELNMSMNEFVYNCVKEKIEKIIKKRQEK
jgi:predicted HicB family RNase H-like nuclease